MKILLVNPYFNIGRTMGKLSDFAARHRPSGLLSLAAYLENNGHEMRVHDAQVHKSGVIDSIADFRPDVVGITSTTPHIVSAMSTSKSIRDEYPELPIILGGIHPSVMPEYSLLHSAADIVVRGEGELTCQELLPKLARGESIAQVKGLSYKKDGKIFHNPPRDEMLVGDDIPLPARHLLPSTSSYRQESYYKRRSTFEVISTSRGCPFNCIFCASQLLTSRKYRFRSIDSVIDEVEYCVEKLGARQIYWEDDNLVVNRNRFFELTERFMRKGFHKRVVSFAQTRVDAVDREVVKRMREFGMGDIGYGMESGVPRLLKVLKKGITIEQIERAVRYTKEAGIEVRGTFMLGIPTETREDSLQTIRFAYGLDLDLARFVVATPYPGTELWEMALREGGEMPQDWERYSLYAAYTDFDPVYTPQGRSPSELKLLQKKANRYFYLRPRKLWKMARSRLFSWREIPGLVVDFIRLLRASA